MTNRDSYNRIAADWDRVRVTMSAAETRLLDLLLDGLPPASTVLDLGCGTGRPMAEAILARGHLVTGVDQAAAPLELARQRFPAAKWIEARIEDFRPAERFDRVLCWDALFHIDRALHEGILAGLGHALAPGGKLMGTVGGSAHPAFTDTMFGHTFSYDSNTPAQTLDILERVGLTLLHSEFLNPPTTGRDKGRFAFVAGRPETPA